MRNTAEHDSFDCSDCIEDGSNIHEHVYNPNGNPTILTVIRKPAEVSKGDTVVYFGEHRVVDLVIDAGSTVFVEFESYDTTDGVPDYFCSVPFEPTTELFVIPAA